MGTGHQLVDQPVIHRLDGCGSECSTAPVTFTGHWCIFLKREYTERSKSPAEIITTGVQDAAHLHGEVISVPGKCGVFRDDERGEAGRFAYVLATVSQECATA
ncbi:hypothetical protein ACYTFC_17645 [Streptomyces globosus]|uniref:hypothetical protein n=1 Tax=Streptomyces TaxID=1883 RepID=UPI00163C3865|nr:hypothetical protein [Streptomyces sp. WAC05292]